MYSYTIRLQKELTRLGVDYDFSEFDIGNRTSGETRWRVPEFDQVFTFEEIIPGNVTKLTITDAFASQAINAYRCIVKRFED